MKQILAVLTLGLFSATSIAFECGTPSPFGAKPENYFLEFEVRELEREEISDLKSVFKKLDGDWRGEGTIENCKRRDGEDIVDTSKVKFDSEFEASENQLSVRHGFYDPEVEVNRAEKETLRIFGNTLRSSDSEKDSSIQLVDVGPNSLSYLRRVSIDESVMDDKGGVKHKYEDSNQWIP